MEFIIKDLCCISQYQYLSSNKRFITKRGKDWMKNYKEQLTIQMKEKNYTILDSENIQVEIIITNTNRRKNDVDNSLHYLLDGMEGIVMTNDRWITKLIAEKKYEKKYDGMTNVIIKVLDRNKSFKNQAKELRKKGFNFKQIEEMLKDID